ncbi:MAG TPA: integrin alpha [Planctomycetota bacterium]
MLVRWPIWVVFSTIGLADSPLSAQRAGRNPVSPTLHAPPGVAQALGPGTVVDRRKISSVAGGFPDDTLDAGDHFGKALTALGDVNGDGFTDLALGSDDFAANGGLFDGLTISGAVYVLFLDAQGAGLGYTKLWNGGGGLAGQLGDGEFLGRALAGLGDLDGDGVPDLASLGGSDGSSDAALWILFLAADGSVKSFRRHGSVFGTALASVGDLDGDGLQELVVGQPEDLPSSRGAVEVFFLAADGGLRARQKIDEANGGFTGTLPNRGQFGLAVAGLGDLEGDGVPELAVAADTGVIWLLSLAPNGTVLSHTTIPDLGVDLRWSLAGPGDLDGNGVPDLVAGSAVDDDGGPDRGALWVLLLEADGGLAGMQKISQTQGGFGGTLRNGDRFGSALAALGDLDGDGTPDVAAGAPEDDDNGAGAAWVLRLGTSASVVGQEKLSDRPGSLLEGTLDPRDQFGRSLALLGDLDGNGVPDLAVAADGDDDGGEQQGAVWILLLRADGSVERVTKIAEGRGSFDGALDLQDELGSSLAALGDLDGDGTPDLAVGARNDDDGGGNRGAVWVLFLRPDGSVRAHQKISSLQGDFTGPLFAGDQFGAALACLGDLDGDGTRELAVGASGDGAVDVGAVWILSLGLDGRVVAQLELGQSAFPGVAIGPRFGASLCSLGDLDGDGTGDLAVGAVVDEFFDVGSGKVRVLFLNPDGSVRAHQEIGRDAGGFTGTLTDDDLFARSLAAAGDLDGDGVTELAVGAPLDGFVPSGQLTRGAVWMLFLERDGHVRRHQKISRDEGGLGIDLQRGVDFASALATLGDRDGDGLDDLAVGSLGDWDGGNHGAVWLLDLDGIARAGFERGDDPERTPLENGRSLAARPGFTRAFTLEGTGANLGPALFDSSPAGPNDPSQDRDLLVAKGHVLILQNSGAPAQSSPGTFDRPNDDQDGGRLVFRFPAPARALALDLVDVDLGTQQRVQVGLVDAAGHTRVYHVPGGWTEDLLLHGAPAWRTLDLETLAPQPGFAAVATAAEDPGFDAAAVVRIEVELGSSGAVDELRWDPHPGS